MCLIHLGNHFTQVWGGSRRRGLRVTKRSQEAGALSATVTPSAFNPSALGSPRGFCAQKFHDLTSIFRGSHRTAVLEINYMKGQKKEAERTVSGILQQSKQKRKVSWTGLGLMEVMTSMERFEIYPDRSDINWLLYMVIKIRVIFT